MPKKIRSHVSRGTAYYRRPGRYNELLKSAERQLSNHSTPAVKQKNLAPGGRGSAAALTLESVFSEIESNGW